MTPDRPAGFFPRLAGRVHAVASRSVGSARRHRHGVLRVGLLACGLAAPMAQAAVKLALPFTDQMVLQRDLSVPVWGTAEPGEHVIVTFAGQTKSATADATGQWQVALDPMPANATPRALKVAGTNTVELNAVLVGEVWFCSGQSNMEVGLERAKTSLYLTPEAKAAALQRIDHELAEPTPGIRVFRAGTRAEDTLKNRWMDCSSEALRNQKGRQGFSATAYYFGQTLARELHVPIGLIEASVGGTTIETWTPPGGRNFVPLVKPVAPFAVRGVIWYQGESNLIQGDDGATYAQKMENLINTWRELWGRADLPFYYVQLPPLTYSTRRDRVRHTPEALPSLREGQAAALRLPRTAMIVTTDLSPANDLHPADKWDVGERLARVALAQTYGRPDIDAASPTFKGMHVNGDKIVVRFDHAGKGLVSKDGQSLTGFEIAGADRRFVRADAQIAGNTVVVSSPAVSQPAAVRFAWHETDRPNLFNAAGLPAAPFRTDDWPVQIVTPASEGDHAADGTAAPAHRRPRRTR